MILRRPKTSYKGFRSFQSAGFNDAQQAMGFYEAEDKQYVF